MDIVLTGTGSPLPDPNRAGPSTLIKESATHVLIDCGRGVVMRMAAAGSMPGLLSGVCITHLHSDHVTDLNDLITMHWIMTRGEGEPLRFFGPPGLQAFIDHTLAALAPDIGYRIGHHDVLTRGPHIEITELVPGDSFTINDITVSVSETEHPPVAPTIGFRFSHDGENGPVAVAVVGDTLPCAGVDELTKDADVYVQTVIRDDIVSSIPNPMLQDILDYHSTVTQAGQTAAKNGVKRLMLTHLVPSPTPEQYDEWRALAAEHFDGEIIIGDDLTTVTI